jgi:hypothetical protein
LPLDPRGAFDAQDADVALFETGDEMRDRARAQLHGRQVERHGPIGKEALGTLESGVEVLEPVDDRRLRSEGKRHIGACPKHQRLALANDA